jgi:hypothetical protein
VYLLGGTKCISYKMKVNQIWSSNPAGSLMHERYSELHDYIEMPFNMFVLYSTEGTLVLMVNTDSFNQSIKTVGLN